MRTDCNWPPGRRDAEELKYLDSHTRDRDRIETHPGAAGP